MGYMDERIKGRKNYPTNEVDPDHFISDEEVKNLIDTKVDYQFKQEDYYKLYNCVQCGECKTDLERFALKQKFLEDGNTFKELDDIKESFETYRSPYPTNKMRIKIPEGIKKSSDTLFFMGCLSTIMIPRYTEHALQYLLKQNIDFTILNKEICCGWHLLASGLKDEFETCIKENLEILKKFQTIICLCPACYYLFSIHIKQKISKSFEVKYITDYLNPSKIKKSGSISIQQPCHLKNRKRNDVMQHVERVLEKSGYDVFDVPHWCCGGGIGWMGRTDNIDAIARKRMKDFKGDYCTTYCVSCWWILRRYSKKCRIKPKVKDIFELLM